VYQPHELVPTWSEVRQASENPPTATRTPPAKKVRDDGGSCQLNSFPAGTLIHTEKGLKPIEEIKIGEKVLSMDENTETTSYQLVTDLTQSDRPYRLIEIALDSGKSIEATDEHPFYIKGKGWNPASTLKVGQVLELHNGTTVVVEEVDTSVRRETVYNFTVANTHNYFVGRDGVLVHNNTDDCFIVTPCGTVLPPHEDYNLVDPNTPTTQGGDWFQLHRKHKHAGLSPHTHYPEQSHPQKRERKYRATTSADIDKADAALRDCSLRRRRNKKDLGGS
jgi:hypothetical protein